MAGARLDLLILPSFFNEIIIFFALSNLVIYWFTTRKIGLHPGDFVRIYLGATVLRILFFGGFIFTVMMMDRTEALENTLFFLICYFLFTTLEILALLREINSQKRVKGGQKDH